MEPKKLAGKVAVITGAASKLGEAIARKFVEHGARVMLTDTNYRSCEKIVEDLNRTYNQTHNTTQAVKVARAKYCDVRKPEEIQRAVDEARIFYGQDLDIFYNNAAINDNKAPPITREDFENTMKVNVLSVLESIDYAGKVMSKNNKGGCILCTGSTTGLLGDMVPSAYSISKTTVIALVRAAAADLARHGVRVNAISPHRVAPPSFDEDALKQIFPKASRTELEEMRRKYMTKPVLSEEDVADAAVYLASDASKGVTGHNLVLDGKFSRASMP